MKKLFLLIAISIAITSCQEEDVLFQVEENSSDLSEQKVQTSVFLVDCPAQTWDGDIDHDCEPPATNCATVCSEISSHSLYPDFVKAVKEGTADEFYSEGYGMQVLPLNTETYNDIVNGSKKFSKVVSNEGIKYAIY